MIFKTFWLLVRSELWLSKILWKGVEGLCRDIKLGLGIGCRGSGLGIRA